jgi:hypothetical protein
MTTTHEALAEAAAEILAPVFPDADEVAFSAFVDEVVEDLVQRFEDGESGAR